MVSTASRQLGRPPGFLRLRRRCGYDALLYSAAWLKNRNLKRRTPNLRGAFATVSPARD
jgi:hypothetical protein